MRRLQPPGWPRAARVRQRRSRPAGGRSCSSAARSAGTRRRVRRRRPGRPGAARRCENIVAVLAEAGAGPEHVVRLTWYVVDREDYLGAAEGDRRGLPRGHGPRTSRRWRSVQVGALIEAEAKVEIEATAVVPERGVRCYGCRSPEVQRAPSSRWRVNVRMIGWPRARVGSRSPCCSCSPPRSRRSLRRAMTGVRRRRSACRPRRRGRADRRADRDEPGSGLTHAWDLDGDGALRRRGRGPRHDHARARARAKRRRPLDRRGRPRRAASGGRSRSTRANSRPTGRLRLRTPVARAGAARPRSSSTPRTRTGTSR